MSSHLRRRALSLPVLLCTTLAVVAAPSLSPSYAAPVASPATCSADGLDGELELDFVMDVTPARVYVGRSVSPKLTVKATIPANVVGLAAFFGVKSASATGTYTVGINGTPTPRSFVFPRTDIPQSATPFTATIVMSLPALTRTTTAAISYQPGPVELTLTGYNKTKAQAADGDSVGSVDAQCTPDSPNQVIGKVAFVKSPTAVTTATSYAREAKKVKAVAKVTAASGVVPRGTVTSVLYRGQTKIKSRTATLVGGRATVVFTGVKKKGTYKVVSRYSGSGAHNPSTKARTFRIG